MIAVSQLLSPFGHAKPLLICSLKDQAPPHLAITHYTELLEDKGLVLAKADAISPHLISVAEVNMCLSVLLTVNTLV